MKQIIPFKKELLFKTKVSEITSISLEHTLSLKDDGVVGGEFHIAGDYKMTEGSINREEFSFDLPFEIALDSLYDMDSIVIDIDNFYYEVINSESLQVNIDVYVEGTKKVEEVREEVIVPEVVNDDLEEELDNERDVRLEKEIVEEVQELVDTIKGETKEEEIQEKNIDSNVLEIAPELEPEAVFSKGTARDIEEVKDIGSQFSILDSMDSVDTYVTYYVYIVKENDTIDKVMEKYGVTREDIALYNDIEDIKPGMKLIIPNHDE